MSFIDQSDKKPAGGPETPNLPTVDEAFEKIEEKDVSDNSTRWADAPFTYEQLELHDAAAWRELTKVLVRIAEGYIRNSFTNPGDLPAFDFPGRRGFDLENYWQHLRTDRQVQHTR